jgi:hypothetical protein
MRYFNEVPREGCPSFEWTARLSISILRYELHFQHHTITTFLEVFVSNTPVAHIRSFPRIGYWIRTLTLPSPHNRESHLEPRNQITPNEI